MPRCGLCKNDFAGSDEKDRVPKLLQCLHVYCVGCLEEQSIKTELIVNIRCPSCNTFTTYPNDDKGINHLKSNYIDYNSGIHGMTKSLRNIPCGECESKSASWYCMQCEDDCASLCEGCAMKHRELKAFRKHEVVPFFQTEDKINPDSQDGSPGSKPSVSRVRIMCDEHNRHELDGYCKKCDMIICLNCAIFDHKEHDYIRISDIAATYRGNIAKSLHPVQEKILSLESGSMDIRKVLLDLEIQNENTRTNVEDLFNNIIKFISDRKDE
eukprot:gene6057-12216_t